MNLTTDRIRHGLYSGRRNDRIGTEQVLDMRK